VFDINGFEDQCERTDIRSMNCRRPLAHSSKMVCTIELKNLTAATKLPWPECLTHWLG